MFQILKLFSSLKSTLSIFLTNVLITEIFLIGWSHNIIVSILLKNKIMWTFEKQFEKVNV